MNKVTIQLKDKETGILSQEIDINNVIYAQGDIEFDFIGPDGEYNTLPYNDFLFFYEDYEVIVNINE